MLLSGLPVSWITKEGFQAGEKNFASRCSFVICEISGWNCECNPPVLEYLCETVIEIRFWAGLFIFALWYWWIHGITKSAWNSFSQIMRLWFSQGYANVICIWVEFELSHCWIWELVHLHAAGLLALTYYLFLGYISERISRSTASGNLVLALYQGRWVYGTSN